MLSHIQKASSVKWHVQITPKMSHAWKIGLQKMFFSEYLLMSVTEVGACMSRPEVSE